jgi:mono/diheme cytochrome c family protein
MMRWIGIGGGLLLLLVFGYVLGIRGWSMMNGGMMNGGMMNGGMMGHEGTQETPQETDAVAGESLFRSRCAACHPGGGNTMMPELPLRGAPQLADFDTFVAFMRDPRLPDGSRGPMPPFSADTLTPGQAKSLYHYILNVLNGATRK